MRRRGYIYMNKDYAFIGEDISKIYKMYTNQNQKILDLIIGKSRVKEFYALKGLNFKIEKGESVGLLGLNGSGKSTLTNILAGISQPSVGSITINGEASVVSVGAGLNNILTGNENIELKGLMIGLTKKQIDMFRSKIIEFADIGAFIDQPIKTYSSGMKSRLGFAIARTLDPDIMLIDEALSVGDPSFTDKCLNAMNKYREDGKTIIFVSHSLAQIKAFCTKAMWLEYGVLKAYGDVEEVLPMYERFLNRYNKMSPEERNEYVEKVIENHNHFLLKK